MANTSSSRLGNALSAVLVVCALVLTGLVVRRELFPPAAQAAAAPATFVQQWREYAAAGQRSGGEAPVTVVVFSDFQCPACRVLAQNLEVIRQRHPGTVSVVYRHFPLPLHPFAPAAAQASECAAKQGRFQAYHDALFQRQDSIGQTSWTAFAQAAGVPDVQAFQACAADTAPVPAIQRDLRDARRLGVNVTPTLLINGHRFDGTPGVESLERYILDARE